MTKCKTKTVKTKIKAHTRAIKKCVKTAKKVKPARGKGKATVRKSTKRPPVKKSKPVRKAPIKKVSKPVTKKKTPRSVHKGATRKPSRVFHKSKRYQRSIVRTKPTTERERVASRMESAYIHGGKLTSKPYREHLIAEVRLNKGNKLLSRATAVAKLKKKYPKYF